MQPNIGLRFVIPKLADFRARFPQIQLEICMEDKLLDPVREGIDCVVRVGALGDSPLVARPLAKLDQLTCASPDYLAARGTPETLEEFKQHSVINYLSSTYALAPFVFNVSGQTQNLVLPSNLAINNAEGYVACACAGLGIIQAPRYHVADALAAGRLREILSEFCPAPVPVSILYPYHAQLSSRLRVFIDWLAATFSNQEPPGDDK